MKQVLSITMLSIALFFNLQSSNAQCGGLSIGEAIQTFEELSTILEPFAFDPEVQAAIAEVKEINKALKALENHSEAVPERIKEKIRREEDNLKSLERIFEEQSERTSFLSILKRIFS